MSATQLQHRERLPKSLEIASDIDLRRRLSRDLGLLWLLAAICVPVLLLPIVPEARIYLRWMPALAAVSVAAQTWLNRRGDHAKGSAVMLGGILIALNLLMQSRLGIYNQAAAAFASLVLAGGLLLGRRGAWTICVLSALSMVGGYSLTLNRDLAVPTTEPIQVLGVGLTILISTTLLVHIGSGLLLGEIDSLSGQERALRNTLRELRTTTVSKTYVDMIIQSMVEMLIVTSPEGRVQTVNRALVSLTGRQEDDLVGRPLSDLLPVEAIAALESTPSARPGETYQSEVEALMMRNTGAPAHIALTRTPLRDRAGRIKGLIYTARDVSARRRAESALESARVEAEAAAKANASLLAAMSHEIRTPLNAIVGLTKVVLDTPVNAEQSMLLESVHESCDALVETIDNILDFSKLDAGRVELRQSPIDPRDCATAAIEMLRLRAESKNLSIRLEANEDVPQQILGDGPRLRQVLVNLLSNAMKFTEQGHILVRISCPRSPLPGALLQFDVCDTGIGIAADDAARLFEPFQQARINVTQSKGTGLGLAICKQLVSLMGGAIWVSSTPGAGSTFSFTVRTTTLEEPIVAEQPSPLSGVVEQPAQRRSSFDASFADRHPLRILVAEDNHLNQRVVRLFLERLGYRADFVLDGYQVLDALEQRQYDLILLDIQMPGLDGVETARRVLERGDAGQPRPRLVAMTAHALEGSREHYLASGLDDYLSKPFRVEELKRVLRFEDERLEQDAG